MEDKKSYKVYKIIMLIVLVAFITFLATSIGMYQIFENKDNVIEQKDTITSEINKFRNIIDKYYLGEIDEEKLKQGAIRGYIQGLEDPYTEYISKEDMKDYLEDTMGNFVGIGIYMVKDEETNRIMILSPIKNSPAEKAGLQPGDYIIKVNDIEYTAEDMTEASNKIKGEENSTVKLEIVRENETITYEINRENIKVNPVDSKVLQNNIGYIEFTSFDEGTAEDFKTKYEELSKQGIKSLIIDLRNNGGGIVDEALEIADYFTPKDTTLLYEVNKKGKEEVTKSKIDAFINIPVIILINENTASSSEILAGALKDLEEARTVGTKTYGKGVIQDVLSLPDGSGIKITSEEYLTPNKTKINKIGIQPDIEVELPETVTNILKIDEKDDTQLQKAIELLK